VYKTSGVIITAPIIGWRLFSFLQVLNRQLSYENNANSNLGKKGFEQLDNLLI
jgi:hypothetical protein